MNLSAIFVDDDTGEGLYSIRYGKTIDEYTRLLNLWSNTLYVTEYCYENRAFINTSYFEGFTIDAIIDKILREAQEIDRLFLEYSNIGFNKTSAMLQHLFKPLNDMEAYLYVYQESKASVIKKEKLNPILRIYAIRISENTYVISGGAIKLVHKMNEHDHTKEEVQKLKKVKNFLINNGFNTGEELKLSV